jgi:plastocyanin
MSPVAHFDGTGWSLVNVPPRRYRMAVEAVAANDVWTLVKDTQVGPSSIEHYDGTSWSSVPTPQVAALDDTPYGPRSGLADLAALSANDIWAVGTISDGLDVETAGLIEHWDGTQWRVVPSVGRAEVGAYGLTLTSVAAYAPDDVWAVGRMRVTANFGLKTFIEHWDGQRWSFVPSPNRGTPDSNDLLGVAAVARDDVWAVGFTTGFTMGQGKSALIEHWDGTRWSVVPTPMDNFVGGLSAVAAVSAGDVWAVGEGVVTGVPYIAKVILHWDGTSWTRVSSSFGSMSGVTALPQGVVFAAGGALHQLCEIAVTDAGIAPSSVTGVALGANIAWHIDTAAAQGHTVTDASGMGLFDSGLRAPGGSFTFTFDAAGSYPIIDQATGRKSTVKVSMTVSPGSGTSATAFTLTFAAASAPAGYAYDLQVKRPGATAYADFSVGTVDPSATFTPDSGPGSYSFRARTRNTSNGTSSGWSSAKMITVR